jgi:hypothetical protein
VLDRLDILARAAQDLAGVLDDARLTVNRPDYWGVEWLEVWQGNPLMPTRVMVNLLGNVLHVRARAPYRDHVRRRAAQPDLPSVVVRRGPGQRAQPEPDPAGYRAGRDDRRAGQ